MSAYIERLRNAGLETALAEVERLQAIIAGERRDVERASDSARYEAAYIAQRRTSSMHSRW